MRIFDQLIALALLLAFVVAFDDVESCLLARPSLLGSSGFVATALVALACPPGPVLYLDRTGHCTHLNLVLS